MPADSVHADDVALFAETPGRFVVTVAPEHSEAFEALLAPHQATCLGEVIADKQLRIGGLAGDALAIDQDIDTLKAAWQRPLDF